MDCDKGENLVAYDIRLTGLVDGRRQLDAGLSGISDEGCSETEENDIDHNEKQARGHHVLLRVAKGFAGEVLLHHVLVETRHSNGNEHAGKQLLDPKLFGHGVGVEHVGVALVGRDAKEVGKTHIEVLEDHHHRCHSSKDEEGGLQGIGPYNGLDATGKSVEEDDGDEDHRGDPEGDAPGGEDKLVEHVDHEVHAEGGAEEARDDEEEGARALAAEAEALLEVGIDGGEVETVVERQEDEGYSGIAEDIAEDHGEIEPLVGQHVAGDGHEGDAGEGGADHTVGHHGPRGLAAGAEEGLIAFGPTPIGEPHDEEKEQRIGCKAQ